MSEASPRSARTKKKSHLAKLAARRRESDDSASELGSRASLNEPQGDLRRHVLSRDVNNSNYYNDDSDEGVSVSRSHNGQRSGHRLPSEGTLNRFQHMNVNGSRYQSDEYDSDDNEDPKGNKRDRDQNSDGDDLRKDTGSFRVKKKSISNESDEEPSNSKKGGFGTLQSDNEMTESDYSEDEKHNLTRTFKRDDDREDLQEHYKQLLSAPEASDSPKMRRRSPLSMRKSELDPVEEQETSDETDAGRKYSQPRPSSLSPTPHLPSMSKRDRQNSVESTNTTNSNRMFGQSRPWSAAMTEDSERSFQSSSALPLITTKEARNR